MESNIKVDCIIGIDPGASGGIVVWRQNAKPRAIKMPKDINDVKKLLEYYKSIGNPIVFLEKLSVRPDDISMGGDGANMGKLYRIQRMMANFEQLKAVMMLAEIPYCMVHPMKWQNTLKLRTAGKVKEEKADRKRRYKDIAGKLYPAIKPTLWSADATLIMHFGRYVLANDMDWVKSNLPKTVQNGLF